MQKTKSCEIREEMQQKERRMRELIPYRTPADKKLFHSLKDEVDRLSTRYINALKDEKPPAYF